jgi:hypothetical protein
MECYWRIERCDVQNHLLAKSTASSFISPVKPMAEQQNDKEESSSSESDDDLAAELEAEMLG